MRPAAARPSRASLAPSRKVRVHCGEGCPGGLACAGRCGASPGPGRGRRVCEGRLPRPRSGRCGGHARSLRCPWAKLGCFPSIFSAAVFGVESLSRGRWQFAGRWPSRRFQHLAPRRCLVPEGSAPGARPRDLDSRVASIARPPPGRGAKHPWDAASPSQIPPHPGLAAGAARTQGGGGGVSSRLSRSAPGRGSQDSERGSGG